MFDGIACVSVAVPSIDDALPGYTDGLGLEVTAAVQESPRGFDLRWIELGRGRPDVPRAAGADQRRAARSSASSTAAARASIRCASASMTSGRRSTTLDARGVRVIPGASAPGHADVGFVHPASTSGVLFEVMQR